MMMRSQTGTLLTALRVILGGVLLVLSLAALKNTLSAGEVGRHAGSWFVASLAGSEAVAAVLLMFPATVFLGGWALLAILSAAAGFHLLHGENPAELLAYMAGIVVVLACRSPAEEVSGGPRSVRLSNAERRFIREFENCRLQSFHHSDHVRLAWLYLRQYPLTETLTRFSRGLKRFAKSRGAEEIYHETITWAFLFLINARMNEALADDFETFAARNPDLLDWERPVIYRYYSKDLLKSARAKQIFLMPEGGWAESPLRAKEASEGRVRLEGRTQSPLKRGRERSLRR